MEGSKEGENSTPDPISDFIKEHKLDLNNLKIEIDENTEPKDKEVLFQIIEKHSKDIKSLIVFGCRGEEKSVTEQQTLSIYRCVSSCVSLQKLELYGVPGTKTDIVMDLHAHSELETLILWETTVESLVPPEGAKFRKFDLMEEILPHANIEKLMEFLPSWTALQHLQIAELRCGTHDSDSCYQFDLDLREHNKLETLMLRNISIKSLLLPNERTRFRYLDLFRVEIAHCNLERIYESVSACPERNTVYMYLYENTCMEHKDSTCPTIVAIRELFTKMLTQ